MNNYFLISLLSTFDYYYLTIHIFQQIPILHLINMQHYYDKCNNEITSQN